MELWLPEADSPAPEQAGSLPEMVLGLDCDGDLRQTFGVLQGVHAALLRPGLRTSPELIEFVCVWVQRQWEQDPPLALKLIMVQVMVALPDRFGPELGKRFCDEVSSGDRVLRALFFDRSLALARQLPPNLHPGQAIVLASRDERFVLVLWPDEGLLVCSDRAKVTWDPFVDCGVLGIGGRVVRFESYEQRKAGTSVLFDCI